MGPPKIAPFNLLLLYILQTVGHPMGQDQNNMPLTHFFIVSCQPNVVKRLYNQQ